jgi:outer membrane lipoprotein-sorting protein
MKRFLVISLLFFFLAPTFSVGGEDEIDTFLKEMETFWSGVDTMVCDFTQRKRLPLFDAEMVSTGSFAFKNPGRMVWRYDPPEETVMAVKPGVVTIYFKANNRAKIIHLKEDEKFPQTMTFGLGGTGDAGGMREKFDVSLTRSGTANTITFISRERGGEYGFEKVAVTFKKDFTPLSTTIYYSADDVTAFEFKNVVINGAAEDETFELVLPKGVQVEEIGSGG